jgi:putative phosphoribosyl transferase
MAMDKLIFTDRKEAGVVLAASLEQEIPRGNKQVIILSLPRGGSIVGAVIAEKLGLIHDLVITRKIGAPFNPEVAIGSITPDGEILKDDLIIGALNITKGYLEEQARQELREINRRLQVLRGTKAYPNITGKTVVLVDDGMATGYTFRAAIKFLQKKEPRQLILAVPVGPEQVILQMRTQVDLLICPIVVRDLVSVGHYYRDFHQISDEEVQQVMK